MTKSINAAKLTWLPKKTFQLEFSLPWTEVKKTYDLVVDQLVKTAKIEGFRPGKAPKDLVEKSADKGRLYGEVINQLLPISYAKAISGHQLRPAVSPKVTIIKAEENQAWEFKAVSCELPEVKLNNYVASVKGALVKSKLWTPDKGDPTKKEDKELDSTQKLNLISQALITDTKIDLPDLLIETEADRMLAKLLDQVQKLGLTIDQYANSNNKTVDQIKTEYHLTAENTLKLELILQAIAEEKNFKVEDKDIDALINASGDEKIKKQLQAPSERAYISSILKKRQTIDYLLSL